jgi:signal transduction histidine kinase
MNGVRITVSNNGPVIPPERKDKVFIPFYTTKKEGSGIGLSICQEIVRAHRGTLSLVSGPEQMTSFVIEL